MRRASRPVVRRGFRGGWRRSPRAVRGSTPVPIVPDRVGLPEDDGRGLVRPERAQRDTSRVEGPTHESMITEFERLFGGVDGRLEGCSPVTTSSRDPRFDPHRVRDALAVADAGADLDGFVEQGERAFATPRAGARSRAFERAKTSAPSMPAARATRTASSVVAIAASSVGSVIWSAPPSVRSALASSYGSPDARASSTHSSA